MNLPNQHETYMSDSYLFVSVYFCLFVVNIFFDVIFINYFLEIQIN